MSLTARKLNREFYLRPTLDVARDLIGKYLVFKTGGKVLSARLVEVEAYIGENDPACHAAVGRTDRNGVMYGPGGYSYVYFIYGMYHCLNVVTENEGFPAAVLIRGAEPVEGVEIMLSQFDNKKNNGLTSGPGKLCKAFGLSRKHNGLDLVGDILFIEDRGFRPARIENSSRIGIKKAVEKKWRFYEAGSNYVSIRNK
ncbi:MAG: DNA-3-methyladenine glycosylase [Candidatus Zixiibacteriota bacterium]|nr:MAG: DNA-3-methyladenine glycosylase [candidate division Zixibacteria bacterium]